MLTEDGVPESPFIDLPFFKVRMKDFYQDMKIDQYIKTAKVEAYKGDGSRYYQCPFCHGHKKLEVHATRPVWFCHKCHEKGHLGSKHRTSLPSSHTKDSRREYWNQFQPVKTGSKQWVYLREDRGLPEDLIKLLHPMSGHNPYRVYLPLYGLGDIPQPGDIPDYIVGREIHNMEPKYLNPPSGYSHLRKSETMWGLNHIQPGCKAIVLVEGIFDAIWEPGIRLALLGKTLSMEQSRFLERISPSLITVMLDGEAHLEALLLAVKLRVLHIPIYISILPDGEDPDSLSRAKVPIGDYKKERVV